MEESSVNGPETDSHSSTGPLDAIIGKLLSAPLAQRSNPVLSPLVDVSLTEDEVIGVCQAASLSLLEQPSLLRIDKPHLPALIVGDLHGQFRDLRLIMARLGDPEEQTFVFLGDYVDRGPQGLEIAILLLALKTRYPEKVFLLRGNHEDVNTTVAYGFYDECCRKFRHRGPSMWLHVMNTFNCLPVAALIADKILCMHGGLSPHLQTLEDIDSLQRPTIIPPYGLMCDLVWSDPENTKGPGWSMSGRGISFSFCDRVVHNFCTVTGVDVIVRAHQITTEMFRCGYMITAKGRMVTLFSAPNYVNTMNDSAVLKVDSELRLRFIVFRPNRNDTTAKLAEECSAKAMAALAE